METPNEQLEIKYGPFSLRAIGPGSKNFRLLIIFGVFSLLTISAVFIGIFFLFMGVAHFTPKYSTLDLFCGYRSFSLVALFRIRRKRRKSMRKS
jgi:hypothetical protein